MTTMNNRYDNNRNKPTGADGQNGAEQTRPAVAAAASDGTAATQDRPQRNANGDNRNGNNRNGDNLNGNNRQGNRGFNGRGQNGGNGNNRRNGNRPNNNAPQAPLNTTPIETLKLSPATETLLLTNNVKIISDLTRRTERDMYRIQNLNKRVLTEIKTALVAAGFDFAQPANTAPKPVQGDNRDNRDNRGRQGDDRDNRGKQGDNRGKQEDNRRERGDNNRRDDRRNDRRDNNKPQQERPERLTKPLEFPDWRKIEKDGKWGYTDGFKTVIEAKFDEIWLFKEDLACVEIEEKCGFIDKTGELVIPCTYETAMSFSEGLASVSENGKWGYIDKQNVLVIPYNFEAATHFENGRARAKIDGKWGFVFPDGTVSFSKIAAKDEDEEDG